jgi:hypothetical protein
MNITSFVLTCLFFMACSSPGALDEVTEGVLTESLPYWVSSSPDDLLKEPVLKGAENPSKLTFQLSAKIYPSDWSDHAMLVLSVGTIADEEIVSFVEYLKELKETTDTLNYYEGYWSEINSLKEDALETSEYEMVPGTVSLDTENIISFTAKTPWVAGNLYLVLLTHFFDVDFFPVPPEMISFYIEEEGDAGETSASADETSYLHPQAGDLVINEVLADPPADGSGDSNQDGLRDSYDDEFIEIVNVSDKTLELLGLQVAVGDQTKHQFERTTLSPLNGVVVFGGAVAPTSYDGCLYLVSQSSLKMLNTGATISLVYEDQAIETVTYTDSGGNDQSLVRWPELTGEFMLHSEIPDAGGALFSPGTWVSGQPF